MVRVDLRRLILALCLVSTVLAVAAVTLASYWVQRNLLIASTLENNRVYAHKLATLTDALLEESRSEVIRLARAAAVPDEPLAERQRRFSQSAQSFSHFNSVLWFDTSNRVIAQSPPDVGLLGHVVDTARSRRALTLREPALSDPFRATTGRWVVTQLAPIMRADGAYDGYVIGSIYLHEKNDLHTLLGEHFFKDGSYTYVVDRQGVILFHPDVDKVGQAVSHPDILDALARGERSERMVDKGNGVTMLTGFAPIAGSGWGVVVMRAEADVLRRLHDVTIKTLQTAAPLILILMALVAWLAARVARPLRQLAQLAHDMDDSQTTARLQAVSAWYVEAAQMKRALLNGLWAINHKIRSLRYESATDMLSGLLNRRGLRSALDRLSNEHTPTAIIVLDIDHFKRVNDTLGHDGGDAIIRMMADRMRRACRSGDIAARTGGEEFVMLLPDTTAAEAWHIAEQLRRDIHETPTTAAMPITVSCGIAQSPENARDLDQAWQLADKALYRAKRSGRDCSFVAEQTDL